jgi:alpha-galactosidase
MRAALDHASRDIVFSLCQYGMGDVWEWGAEVGGNCWRTTGDIGDSWSSMSGIGFGQNGHEKFAGPGHWNDPDMLVVGKVGWGLRCIPRTSRPTSRSRTSRSGVCLSSPLLIGCDMSHHGRFHRGPACQRRSAGRQPGRAGQAGRAARQGRRREVWARPLADGTMAVGLFNRGPVRRGK